MSDPDQPDPDQRGEELDESVGDEYPPDRPPRLDDDGGFEPETWEGEGGEDAEEDDDYDEAPDRGEASLVGDPDVGAVDDEAELVGDEVRDDDVGPLDPEDEFTGDETTRDYPTERVPPSAEESAVHVEDDDEG
jgi:hypothetical protein